METACMGFPVLTVLTKLIVCQVLYVDLGTVIAKVPILVSLPDSVTPTR